MLLRTANTAKREGITLIEVIVSLAIFLLSIIALFSLMDLSSESAREIVNQSRGTRLAESKMAEFVCGAEPLSGSSEGSFEEEPEWNWSAEIETDILPSLYRVTVTVSREEQNGKKASVSITQMLLDPTMRGGLSSSSSSSSSTGTTGTTP
jgi:general secretion pathway protein I